jgi:hypothetical protein
VQVEKVVPSNLIDTIRIDPLIIKEGSDPVESHHLTDQAAASLAALLSGQTMEVLDQVFTHHPYGLAGPTPKPR